jgi:hypothetical protein
MNFVTGQLVVKAVTSRESGKVRLESFYADGKIRTVQLAPAASAALISGH